MPRTIGQELRQPAPHVVKSDRIEQSVDGTRRLMSETIEKLKVDLELVTAERDALQEAEEVSRFDKFKGSIFEGWFIEDLKNLPPKEK